MEQVALVDLMVLTELMQVSLSCLLGLWGILWAGLSLQLPSSRPLLLVVTHSKTGPSWQHGGPTRGYPVP